MKADAIQWSLPCPNDLLWEQWEKDYTIFDRKTRETHLINELPAEILRIISLHPATTKQVSERLSQLCEVENDLDWVQKTADIIINLSSLGLIEQRRR